jgi:hypothetical protein
MPIIYVKHARPIPTFPPYSGPYTSAYSSSPSLPFMATEAHIDILFLKLTGKMGNK